jgi:hypothetical protein
MRVALTREADVPVGLSFIPVWYGSEILSRLARSTLYLDTNIKTQDCSRTPGDQLPTDGCQPASPLENLKGSRPAL